MSLTWAVFEILGTVAFAFSGAAVGLTRGMDVFGIALLSVVTAVGGGILRDVLADGNLSFLLIVFPIRQVLPLSR